MKSITPVLALALLVLACQKQETEFLVDTVEVEDTEEAVLSETEIIEGRSHKGISYVYFSDEMLSLVESDLTAGNLATRSMGLNQALDELGIISMERVFPDAGEYEPRTRKAGLHKWYAVTFDESISVVDACENLSSVSGIEIAEPVFKAKLATVNDRYYSEQWNLGTVSTYGINVEQVWDEFTMGSSSVIVSVVDGGIRVSHPDLAANVIAEGDDGSQCFVSGYSLSGHSHGTHVAGIISAVTNNKVGVAGIAGGDYANGVDGVKLLSCQIFVETSSGDDVSASNANIASAIKWGADHGAVISQNSWSYSPDSNDDGEISSSELKSYKNSSTPAAVSAAIDYFVEYAGCDNDGNQLSDSPMKGGVLFFAAGNDAIDWGIPACLETVIAVGATDHTGSQASYSNYGDWVDIAAPGGTASNNSSQYILSTYYDTEYGEIYAYMVGTSMACPHVSGVAALMLSYLGCEGYTAEMLTEALLGGANNEVLPSDAQIGPFLDAYGAITYSFGSGDIVAVSDYSVSAVSGNTLEFSWTVETGDSGVLPYGYMLLASENKSLLDDLDFSEDLPSGVYSADVVRPTSYEAGASMSGSITELEFETDYYVAIVAYTYSGSYSDLSEVKQVATQENNPPEIIFSETGTVEVRKHQSVSVAFTVEDPEGHSFSVSLKESSTALSITDEGDGNYTLNINGIKSSAGTFDAVVCAEDYYGKSSQATLSYQVYANHAPVVSTELPNILFTSKGSEEIVVLDEYFYDEDGEELTYAYSFSSSSTLYGNLSADSSLQIISRTYGSCVVTATATDYFGETASDSFSVLVREAGVTVEAYPNPVSSVLHIRTGEDELSTKVKLTNSTGKTVYETVAVTSAFNVLDIDVSSFANGQYKLAVEYGGETYSMTIQKQ